MPDLKAFLFLFVLLPSSSSYAQNEHKLQQLLAPFAETKHLKLAYQENVIHFFLNNRKCIGVILNT